MKASQHWEIGEDKPNNLNSLMRKKLNFFPNQLKIHKKLCIRAYFLILLPKKMFRIEFLGYSLKTMSP
jgi:hypothetical protein